VPRPKADLDALAVPKEVPASRVGEGAPAPIPVEQPAKAYAHTLSLRLSAAQYRRLRRYVAGQEDQTGRRLTHQAIIEAALSEYLDRHGG
jgi:hypothetical protein